MKINVKTRKSHSWNEDRFIIGKNLIIGLLIVIDIQEIQKGEDVHHTFIRMII